MSKTANLNIRMQPEIKQEAEAILNNLGISASNAIEMFYRQIILTKSIPFEIKEPEKPNFDISNITKEEFKQMILEGLQDIQEGRQADANTVFNSIHKKIGKM